MLDELPFETDDAAHPRSHRRRNGGRTFFTLLLVVVLLGTLGVAGWFGFDKVKGFFTADDYEGDGNGVTVQVTVAEGALIADIANTLYDAGVVKSGQAFVEAAEENPDSQGIQPGTYTLQKEMSAKAALTALLDPASRGFPEINVHPGQPLWGVYKTLSVSTGIPVADFEEAGADPVELGVPEDWFVRNDGKSIEKSLEGFLLPDTYRFEGNMTAEDMLAEMVGRFLDYVEEVDFVGKVADLEFDISPYEVLIVASLAQGEASASRPEDMGKVARVVYNRLYADYACGYDLYNCLQFDSALNYGIVLAGGEYTDSADLTQDQLDDASNPYNTHLNAGLTPTPINSPSTDALAGAIDPPEGDWIFFVAVDKDGTTKFSDNISDFDDDQDEACLNGVLSCDPE